MSDSRTLDAELLLALARMRGFPLAVERTPTLVPPVSSLLARLARLADQLPPEAAPPPETPGGLPSEGSPAR